MIRRRDLLAAGAGSIASLAQPSASADEPSRPPRSPLKVVVTGGHPGDPEYGCGGTIARLAAGGHDVVLLYLNDGVPEGKPRDGVRRGEAARACEILNARPLFADQTDGDAIVDRPHDDALTTMLAREAPDLVFTHWPLDNHADHRAMAMLVYHTWLQVHKGFSLYYYEVSSGEDTVQFAPTHYLDITAVEPQKQRACFAHASQSPQRYYALQDQTMRFRGLEKGCQRAEAFIHLAQSPDRLHLID